MILGGYIAKLRRLILIGIPHTPPLDIAFTNYIFFKFDVY